YGVARLYSPHDGQALGLQGMIADMLARADVELATGPAPDIAALDPAKKRELARLITLVEAGRLDGKAESALKAKAAQSKAPVIGITGTGGAGKSSLTDELVRRFRLDQPDLAIAIIAVDPSRRKSGGALLGDRIRMNAIDHPKVYMRSLGTRGSGSEISDAVPGAIAAVKAAGYNVVIV